MYIKTIVFLFKLKYVYVNAIIFMFYCNEHFSSDIYKVLLVVCVACVIYIYIYMACSVCSCTRVLPAAACRVSVWFLSRRDCCEP